MITLPFLPIVFPGLFSLLGVLCTFSHSTDSMSACFQHLKILRCIMWFTCFIFLKKSSMVWLSSLAGAQQSPWEPLFSISYAIFFLGLFTHLGGRSGPLEKYSTPLTWRGKAWLCRRRGLRHNSLHFQYKAPSSVRLVEEPLCFTLSRQESSSLLWGIIKQVT